MHFLSTRKQPKISNIYAYMLKSRVTRDTRFFFFLGGGVRAFHEPLYSLVVMVK